MTLSSRFQVYGIQDGYLEVGEATEVEVRCTHCGSSQRYGDDQMTTPLMELVEWAEAHKCHRGQHTNTTGRSTDRPTNAPRSVTEAEPFRVVGSMTGRLPKTGPIVMTNAVIQGTATSLAKLLGGAPHDAVSFADPLVAEYPEV